MIAWLLWCCTVFFQWGTHHCSMLLCILQEWLFADHSASKHVVGAILLLRTQQVNTLATLISHCSVTPVWCGTRGRCITIFMQIALQVIAATIVDSAGRNQGLQYHSHYGIVYQERRSMSCEHHAMGLWVRSCSRLSKIRLNCMFNLAATVNGDQTVRRAAIERHCSTAIWVSGKFSEWYESDDQFPKLHSSAKLGKLSGSVCT